MSTLPSYPQEKLDEWKAQYIELLRSTGRLSLFFCHNLNFKLFCETVCAANVWRGLTK